MGSCCCKYDESSQIDTSNFNLKYLIFPDITKQMSSKKANNHNETQKNNFFKQSNRNNYNVNTNANTNTYTNTNNCTNVDYVNHSPENNNINKVFKFANLDVFKSYEVNRYSTFKQQNYIMNSYRNNNHNNNYNTNSNNNFNTNTNTKLNQYLKAKPNNSSNNNFSQINTNNVKDYPQNILYKKEFITRLNENITSRNTRNKNKNKNINTNANTNSASYINNTNSIGNSDSRFVKSRSRITSSDINMKIRKTFAEESINYSHKLASQDSFTNTDTTYKK